MRGTGSSSAWACEVEVWPGWAVGRQAREQQLSRVRKQEQQVSSMALEDGDGLRLQDDVGRECRAQGGALAMNGVDGVKRGSWFVAASVARVLR